MPRQCCVACCGVAMHPRDVGQHRTTQLRLMPSFFAVQLTRRSEEQEAVIEELKLRLEAAEAEVNAIMDHLLHAMLQQTILVFIVYVRCIGRGMNCVKRGRRLCATYHAFSEQHNWSCRGKTIN